MGSEMCIRDSAYTADLQIGALSDSLATATPEMVVIAGGFDNAESCLLYTSDAADDLLCVDLGGPRIINKKT